MCVCGGGGGMPLHIHPVPNKPCAVPVDVKPSIPFRPQTSELVITVTKNRIMPQVRVTWSFPLLLMHNVITQWIDKTAEVNTTWFH